MQEDNRCPAAALEIMQSGVIDLQEFSDGRLRYSTALAVAYTRSASTAVMRAVKAANDGSSFMVSHARETVLSQRKGGTIVPETAMNVCKKNAPC
jgi:hypothetical protein